MIEKELTELKERVARLEAGSGAQPVRQGTWREAIGFAKDAELFDEAMRLGAEWRAKANAEGW